MAINAVLGSSTANAYIGAPEADAIFADSLKAARWAALSAGEKTIALMAATQNLEVLEFEGVKASPSTDDPSLPQALQWPRTDLVVRGYTVVPTEQPLPIKQATSFLALELHDNPNAIWGSGASSGSGGVTGAIKKQQLGDLSQEFYDVGADGPVAVTNKVDATAPLVLQRFPWLVDLLDGYLKGVANSSGSRVILRVRS